MRAGDFWQLDVGDKVTVHARISGTSLEPRAGTVVKASRYIVSVEYPRDPEHGPGRPFRRLFRRRDGNECGCAPGHGHAPVWHFWITQA
jgi:hypothetical protein